MPIESAETNHHSDRTFQDLTDLRQFPGPPKDFWPAYVLRLASLAAARLAKRST